MGVMMEDRLREVLMREGITAYRLWKELGIDQSVMSKFLRGKGGISLKKMGRIADHLGYDLLFVKRRPSRKGGKE